MYNIILVGERAPKPSVVTAARYYDNKFDYWRTQTDLGAYADRRSCERLSLIGLKFEYKLNLCGPAIAGNGSWRLDEAAKAAELLLQSVPDNSVLVCAGTRPARAIAKRFVPYVYPQAFGVIVKGFAGFKVIYLTRIPRLNQTNQQWSDTKLIYEVADRIAANLKVIA